MFRFHVAAWAPAWARTPWRPSRYDGRGATQRGTRVLICLWDSLMFGRVPGTFKKSNFGVPRPGGKELSSAPNAILARRLCSCASCHGGRSGQWLRYVLGSWVGVRNVFHLSLFLSASRIVLPQDPSTDPDCALLGRRTWRYCGAAWRRVRWCAAPSTVSQFTHKTM